MRPLFRRSVLICLAATLLAAGIFGWWLNRGVGPPPRPSTPPPSLSVMASGPDFAAWSLAADKFLKQPWRTSNFSGVGAKAKVASDMPGPDACFESVVDALPPARLWPHLPEVTRARLSRDFPKNSGEVLDWTDQRLLHLWALMLNLPQTRDEARATLDDIRTVRWLIRNTSIPDTTGRKLDYEFENRMVALDKYVRPALEMPGVAGFRLLLEKSQGSPREQLIAAVGEPMYHRLQKTNAAEKLSAKMENVAGGAVALAAIIPESSRVFESAEKSLDAAKARKGDNAHEGILEKAEAKFDALAHPGKQDPAAAALLQFGPLPVSASVALGGEISGAKFPGTDKIPDLLSETTPARALEMVSTAAKENLFLDWSEAGATSDLAARALAEGRLHPTQKWSEDFLEQFLSKWPEPIATRGQLGLALIEPLRTELSKEAQRDGSEKYSETQNLLQDQALCLLAAGKGRAADGFLGSETFKYWEVLNTWPSGSAADIFAFAQGQLGRHPKSPLSYWETMLTAAHRSGHDQEAWQLVKDEKDQLDRDLELFAIRAQINAGAAAAAAETLLALLDQPQSSESIRRTAWRTEALTQLLDLGIAEKNSTWQKEALERLAALIKVWTIEKDGESDGDEPWMALPGKLAALGQLDLALAAAKLNVRWRLANAEAGEVFVLSDRERTDYLFTGPASAMAGVLQIYWLQRNYSAVIDYLQKEPDWPARDLVDVQSFADPSFAEGARQPIWLLVAESLEALNRGDEAKPIRDAQTPAMDNYLKSYLSGPLARSVTPAHRRTLEYLITNEVKDGEDIDFVALGAALEEIPLGQGDWHSPRQLLLLTAAAEKRDSWIRNGPAVPLPPVTSLRTEIISSANALAVVRDALLANVSDPMN